MASEFRSGFSGSYQGAGGLLLQREIEFYFKVSDTNDDVGRC